MQSEVQDVPDTQSSIKRVLKASEENNQYCAGTPEENILQDDAFVTVSNYNTLTTV